MEHKKIICFVIGTRPEAVKMAPIIKACDQSPLFKPYVITTAQHREIMDNILEVFNVRVDEDLNIMLPNQTLSDLTSRLLLALGEVISNRFSIVLAEGDTTSILAAALISFYQKVPFGHVEAGLRSGNMYDPYPEEMNRVLVSRLAALHFAPTALARENLLHEGVPESQVFLTGNTIIDALRMVTPIDLPARFLLDTNKRIVLITAHRRENFGEPMQRICRAILRIADHFPEINFVYPVHPNPQVSTVVNDILANKANIYLLPPLNYQEFIALMKQSYLILTDSGGVEEEAPALNKPLIVLRDETERPEVIDLGLGVLVGTDEEKIYAAAVRLLTDENYYSSMCKNISPYGDGHASERIIDILAEKLRF